MILQIKCFKCIIMGIWISVPFLEWVAKWSRWDIFPSVGSSVPAHSKPVTWNQNLGDHTNSWMWFFSNHVPTGLVNFWLQQMTVCQLLISLLLPVLAAAYLCSCSEFCLDILVTLFITFTMNMGIWKVLPWQSAYLSIQKQGCRKVLWIQFVYFSKKIRLWSIHCVAEGITNNVLTFMLKYLVWCVIKRLAVIVSGKPLLVVQ
jgi:hypothetical protein